MSLFKKPNKNIRRREVETEDDDPDSREEVDISAIKARQRNGGHIKAPSIKQTLLSFGEEWNEADDGEVFKVKKSVQSRKFRKQVDKDREERKKKSLARHERSQISEKSTTELTEKIITTDDQVTIKIKNPISGPMVTTTILSGFSAEMAGYQSESEDETESETIPHHKFSPPDQVKMLLRSGRIPDAALIHAARKRRQQAREMGGTPEYTNGDSDSVDIVKVSDGFSRLVREDDNDEDDDEERINMAGIVSFSADRERNREGLDVFLSSENVKHEEEEEEDKDEWETQQIRKVVSDAQIAAVQQESYYMQQYANNTKTITSASSSMRPTASLLSTTIPIIPPIFPSHTSSVTEPPVTGFVDIADRFVSSNPEQIYQNLRNTLEQLKTTCSKRDTEQNNRNEELNALYNDKENRRVLLSDLAERFKFYQDLRGYIIDLVECLDEKIPLINSLEQRLISMYQKRATELIGRRRQDIKDQVEELTLVTKNLTGTKRNEEHIRRAAEREGRRIRRSKNRQLSSHVHVDGMSSDDEITEMVAVAYRNQREIIEGDTRRVFEDVVDDFVTVDAVLKYFSRWRNLDRTAYIEAYANICLPKILGPIIRVNMLMWNPLNKDEETSFENLNWIRSVTMYAADSNETTDTLSVDPDLYLLPKLIDKIVIPKLEQIIKVQWDPLSNVETMRLTSLIRLLVEYPCIGPKSKSFTQLINTVIDKMKDCVENDIFIPLFTKQGPGDNSKFNMFFQRQFAGTVKLFGNVLNWYNIIKDEILIDVAVKSLLNRYLLMAIRTFQPTEAAAKCILVVQHLPSLWLQTRTNLPPQLSQFIDYIRSILPKLDITQSVGRDAFDRLLSLTKNL